MEETSKLRKVIKNFTEGDVDRENQMEVSETFNSVREFNFPYIFLNNLE